MADLKYIDIAEFRALGLVAEINRQILHPLGLALSVKVEDDGSETLNGVWDYRDDPEGVIFGYDHLELMREGARKVAALLAERTPAREEALGYVVQPVDT